MTLQIVRRTTQEEGEVIELHGWLCGPELDAFEAVCASHPLPLRIDLQNLAGASADGVLALKAQRARGASLIGASPYIDLLLRGPAPPGGTRGGRGAGGTP